MIAISVILSTIAIVYSNEGRSQVALSVEAAKVSQLILQAKQLAIATYSIGGSRPACAYGMYFDIQSSTYSLFVYSPTSTETTGFCPSLAATETSTFDFADDAVEYSGGSWEIPVTQGLTMQSQAPGNPNPGTPSAVAVIFFPPDPQTLITAVGDSGMFSNKTAYVDLATVDGSASETIMITPAGQITL